MSDPTDIDKQGTKVTSRVLWGAAIVVLALLLSAPLGAWVVADRAGRSFWSRVQLTLKGDGEATTLSELARPSIGPDDENYGSITILKNIASEAGQANRETLNEMFTEGSRRIPSHLKPSPGLPPVDMADWACFLWIEVETEYAQNPALRKRKQTERLPNPILNKGTPSERIENYLNHWEPTISKLREGIDRKRAYFEPPIDSRDRELPESRSMAHLGPIRSAALACYLRALLAARNGDSEACLVHLETMSRLAEACANEHQLSAHYEASQIMLMVETAIVEGFRTTLWRDDPGSLRQCMTMLQHVDLHTKLGPALRDYILETTDQIGACATLEGRSMVAPHGTQMPDLTWYPPGWYQNQQGVYLGLANAHLFKALRNDACFGDYIEAAKRFDATLVGSLNFSHQLITMFTPLDGIHHAYSVPACAEAYRRMAMVAIALELYAINHQQDVPPSLAALVPAYLEKIPDDPMDGAPMRYRQLPAGSFRLWSIALDLTDDGGKLNMTPNRSISVDPSFHNYTGDWPWPDDISAAE